MSPHRHPASPKHLKVGGRGKIHPFGSRNPENPGGSWRRGMFGGSGWLCWDPTCGTGTRGRSQGFHHWFGLQILGFGSVLGSVPLGKPLLTPQLWEGDKSGPAGVIPASLLSHPGISAPPASRWDQGHLHPFQHLSPASLVGRKPQSRARELPRLPSSGLTARE